MHAEGLQFAQQKQAEYVVDVGIGENGANDGRLAEAFAGMQFGRGFDLRAQIGRSAEQEPGAIVGADGELRLGAGFAVEGSGAQGGAVGAGAIPLGETSARAGSENFYAHGSRSRHCKWGFIGGANCAQDELFDAWLKLPDT
jgi:hypothetical protein